MTPAQLAVAQRHRGWHADAFGFDNCRFIEGHIERLDQLELPAASFDVACDSNAAATASRCV